VRRHTGAVRHRLVGLACTGLLLAFAVLAGACGDDDGGAGSAPAGAGSAGGGVVSTDKEDFSLPALNGPGQDRLADFRGHPVVVNFFASWCTPCRRELPAFHKVSTELAGAVTFIGVNSNDSGNGLSLAQETGVTDWPLARDQGGRSEDGLARALRSPGLPTTAFYDAQGQLVGQSYSEVSEAELRDRIRELFGIPAP
jgi:thiol-disulfide isomerase/thioredoxin